MKTLYFVEVDTEPGLVVVGDEQAIYRVFFSGQESPQKDSYLRRHLGPYVLVAGPKAWAQKVKQNLAATLSGQSTDELPLKLYGTEFQKKVWGAIAKLAFGKTCSYADIAGRIGKPKAFRGIGQAAGANPLPILIPCHRVIGKNRRLTGFGGGIDLKRALLEREGIRVL